MVACSGFFLIQITATPTVPQWIGKCLYILSFIILHALVIDDRIILLSSHLYLSLTNVFLIAEMYDLTVDDCVPWSTRYAMNNRVLSSQSSGGGQSNFIRNKLKRLHIPK